MTLAWKGLPGMNTLAYLISYQENEVNTVLACLYSILYTHLGYGHRKMLIVIIFLFTLLVGLFYHNLKNICNL
jgi:hypothetical protein